MSVIIRFKKLKKRLGRKGCCAPRVYYRNQMDTMFSNSLNDVISQVKRGATWLYKQDYTGMLARIDREKMWLQISFVALMVLYAMFLFNTYCPRTKEQPRVNKQKLEPDPQVVLDRNIKRRLSLQAEKYRHASAFQTIQTQVGEDVRSWPVILLNEVILLREDLARLQKKVD